MNLFLLLSALLSALTGLSDGARAVEPAAITQSLTTTTVKSIAVAIASVRPVQVPVSLPIAAQGSGSMVAIVLDPLAVRLTNRRRE